MAAWTAGGGDGASDIGAGGDRSPADPPLFAVWAFHAVHSPYQLPEADERRFAFVPPERRAYHAMVARTDTAIGKLVALLKSRRGGGSGGFGGGSSGGSMYDHSLLVFSADNGGAITQQANNYPLRGGKHSSQCHRNATRASCLAVTLVELMPRTCSKSTARRF